MARTHRSLHVDACFPEPAQVLLHLIGVHDVESPLTSVETVLDERAKDPVLFLDAVEERADVTVLTENAPCKLHGMLSGFHGPPRNARNDTPFK